MAAGWKVDIAGATAVIDRTADAGSSMQDAAVDVDAALRDVVSVLAETDAAGSAQGFMDAHRGTATAAVRSVQQALSAATGAMNAFAEADAAMAHDTDAAGTRAGDRSRR